MDSLNDDYDTAWKTAIMRFLPEFIGFYFPVLHAAIDWGCPPVFLDQDLAQLVRDATLGRRRIDKLVRVHARDGGRTLYLHIEVQCKRDRGFAERLFTYHYRIYDRFRAPVCTLVILADPSPTWRPSSFGYTLQGCTMSLAFPTVKLIDWRDRLDALAAHDNVFGLLTAAHILTQQTRRKHEVRCAAKLRLTGLLLEHQWEGQRTADLLDVLNWMMTLPQRLQSNVMAQFPEMVRRSPMTLAFTEQLKLQSLEQGLREGMQLGLRQGAGDLLTELLMQRFGPIPDDYRCRIADAQAGQLRAWAKRLLQAQSLPEVFGADAPRSQDGQPLR